MKKINLKFNFHFLPDRDKLAFIANPQRDWLIMLIGFVILFTVMAILHGYIYFYLRNTESVLGPETESRVIDEEKLDQAVLLIEERNSQLLDY